MKAAVLKRQVSGGEEVCLKGAVIVLNCVKVQMWHDCHHVRHFTNPTFSNNQSHTSPLGPFYIPKFADLSPFNLSL